MAFRPTHHKMYILLGSGYKHGRNVMKLLIHVPCGWQVEIDRFQKVHSRCKSVNSDPELFVNQLREYIR